MAKHMRKDAPVIPEEDEATQRFDVAADEADRGHDYLTTDAEHEEKAAQTFDVAADEADQGNDYLILDAEREGEAAEPERSFGEEYDFEPLDVSEPQKIRKEADIYKEAMKNRRRDWLRTHQSYLFAAVGLVLVALIIFGVYTLYQNSNPISRLMHAASKDFGTSFDFEAEVTENGRTVMSYSGSVSADRGKRQIEAVYEADYDSYTYSAALTGDTKNADRGVLYNDQWTVNDCTDSVQDFFEFDKSFRGGKFNGGAFLRFTGLSSDYKSRQLVKFVNVVKKRLSTNSAIATVSSSKVDGGMQYHYNIDLYELLNLIVEDGAPIFYHSSDYDSFVTAFHENERGIRNAVCTADYVIDSSGYLRSFEIKTVTNGREFGFSCEMSNFGSASVELPDAFVDAIQKEEK